MAWLPKKTVVVPIDFSMPASAHALETARELVANPKDLHVLHVTPPPPPIVFGHGEVWTGPNSAERLKVVTESLTRFLEEHQAAGATPVAREGDPGLVIADYAEQCHADLIVIPSHGYHGVKRVLIGSVAERVLRHAECPVLVLRHPELVLPGKA